MSDPMIDPRTPRITISIFYAATRTAPFDYSASAELKALHDRLQTTVANKQLQYEHDTMGQTGDEARATRNKSFEVLMQEMWTAAAREPDSGQVNKKTSDTVDSWILDRSSKLESSDIGGSWDSDDSGGGLQYQVSRPGSNPDYKVWVGIQRSS